MADSKVMDVFTPGSHGSTYGGNPLACAIADAAIRRAAQEKLVERSAELGAVDVKSGFEAMKSPCHQRRGIG